MIYVQTMTAITLYDVIARLSAAVLLGGIIGVEREYKRRPAGLRTHMLICLGAAMTTLTSQYLLLNMNYYTDITRLGAQVIAGIGFIGTGTIIVSRGHRIIGLTTAAGLWTAAIVGMAVGAGFYIGGVAATVLILVTEMVFSVAEHKILRNNMDVNVLMEYNSKDALARVFELCKMLEIRVQHVEITHNEDNGTKNEFAIFYLRINKAHKLAELLNELGKEKSIETVKQL